MNNRPITFRVWNNKTKKWIHGPKKEVNLFGETILFGEFMRVSLDELNDCVALEFTGLTDKNDEEIYEGDILNSKSNRWVVEYDTAGARFICRGLFYSKPIYDLHRVDGFKIGNIFENPELLIDTYHLVD